MLTDVSEENTAPIFMVEESDFFAVCFIPFSLLDLLFNPEDMDDMSLRNIGRLSTEYMALYPRSQNSSTEEDLERVDGCLTEVYGGNE
jgi:hypothetical protein